MKTELRFTLDGQKLRRIDDNTVAANAVNVPTAVFENLRENEWADFGSYTAEFRNADTVISVPLIGSNECPVPHEVLVPGYMRVSVFAETVNDTGEITVSITSTEVDVCIERGPSKTGNNSRAPTADEVTAIQAAAEKAAEIADTVRKDADNGVFAGPPGTAATVKVGSVTTLEEGAAATVENVGNEAEAVLNFGIPKGMTGADGISLYAIGTLAELRNRIHSLSGREAGFGATINVIWIGYDTNLTMGDGSVCILKPGNCYKIDGTYINPATVRYNSVVETISFNATVKAGVFDVGGTVDLIIFAGQSNMAGRGDGTASKVISEAGREFRAVSDPTMLYEINESVTPFGYAENKDDGISDINNSGELKKSGSLVPSFINAYYDKTGIPVVAVSASEGSTTSKDWTSESRGLYTDLISRCLAAKEWLVQNGYSVRHTFMVWLQGEGDASNAVEQSTYISNINKLVNTLLVDYIDKCLMIRIGYQHNNTYDATSIMEAQSELYRNTENIVMISSKLSELIDDADYNGDGTHFSQAALDEVGYDAGVRAAEYVNSGITPVLYDSMTEKLLYKKASETL